MLVKLKQIILIALYNFKGWRKNIQVIMAFLLTFTICYILSDKVVKFSCQQESTIQFLEPFIWTFGDSSSIFIISLPLIILLSDAPRFNQHTPYVLHRTTKGVWMLGQILYGVVTTFIYQIFVFLSTCILAGYRGYSSNMWSKTAAILAYSKFGEHIAVPAYVKVLERTFPYQCSVDIFLLMLGYSMVLSSVLFLFNINGKNRGIVAGIIYSVAGYVLKPDFIQKWMGLKKFEINKAYSICGWISPLSHGTYVNHNFGYDKLPKIYQSYMFFAVLSIMIYLIALRRIKKREVTMWKNKSL